MSSCVVVSAVCDVMCMLPSVRVRIGLLAQVLVVNCVIMRSCVVSAAVGCVLVWLLIVCGRVVLCCRCASVFVFVFLRL